MNRFAYFISAYKRPESIIRLINVLTDDSDHFYVHFDRKIGAQIFNNWKALIEQNCRTENIQVLSEFRSNWGSFGVSNATLNAMSYFENLKYDYFINLTGECYPLKPPGRIRENFKNQNSGFMTFWKMPYKGWYQGGMNRIQNRFYFLAKKEYPYVRIFHVPRLRKKLPCSLEPYGGWSLFCFPKDIVGYVLEFLKNNPNVKSFFKRTFAPCEMIFQTILMNSPVRDRIVNDNKRFMEFIGAHPRILTKDDFPKLMNSGKLFARKFDPDVDKRILDIIDYEIIKSKECSQDRYANSRLN